MQILTSNTDTEDTTAAPVSPQATNAASASTSISTPTGVQISRTPIPVPVPYTQLSMKSQLPKQAQPHSQSQPLPPPPIQTQVPPPPSQPRPHANKTQAQTSSRPSSPVRPTASPITPPLNPTQLPPRPDYTHSAHVDAVPSAVPRPEPIDFDSNPDVLALKSAISILQMQKRKATADMAELARVKGAALADPAAFVADLTAGRVGVEGDGLFPGSARDRDSSSDDEDETLMDAGEASSVAQVLGDTSEPVAEGVSTAARPSPPPRPTVPPHTKTEPEATTAAQPHGPTAWSKIPKPQNIVRCPPINWSQYAVAGDSLDRLHAEQVSRPAQGVPAFLTADGHFEFRAGMNDAPGRQETYPGVAAPYTPGKDRLTEQRKAKGPKR
ncbi:hypothetical protein F5Y15DRAFT_18075 [Xylariaceae sp. FL0016]|nr:hypothetical protein F5Y15DRAFT_18075 [Xylariaceae sp. FL0016]